MQSNSVSKIMVIVGLLLLSLFVVIDLFTSAGNIIAQFYRYAMVAGGVFGLLNPRPAFYMLVTLTAYLDFTKRLMIFDAGVSKIDLYFVLGVAPALLCGIAAHVIYTLLVSAEPERRGLTKLCIVTLAVTAALGVVGVLGGTDRFKALGDAVNAVIYMLLLPVVPVLFGTPEELRKLLKSVVVIYTPAVIYMLVHFYRAQFMGLNPPIFDWELAYVKSGMTIEIRQLSERVFRPFGTFNSAANASMVLAAFLGLVIGSFWKQPFLNRAGGSGGMMRFLLAGLILVAVYATYSRTGWLFVIIIPLASCLFRNRITTFAVYTLGILATVSLILASPYLLKYKILNELSGDLSRKTDEMSQVTNISTMNDRLEGYRSLVRNPKIWTPLGFKVAYPNPESVRQSIPVHDALTVALMKFGYIPLFVGGIFALSYLSRMHRYIWIEKDPLPRHMAATCLAISLVLCLGTLVNSAQLMTYPVNFWVWFMLSCVTSLLCWRKENPVVIFARNAMSSEEVHPRQLHGVARGRFQGQPV